MQTHSDNYHNIAQYLYQILDDIDTVTDMAKNDDKLYRKIVERLQAKKSAVVETCDGYSVTFVHDFVKPPQN